MTYEEIMKIPFHFVSHISLESEHCSTYADETGRLGFCTHTKKKKNGDFGRSYTHYRIDSKIFKTKEKFIEALKHFAFAPQDPVKGGKYDQ